MKKITGIVALLLMTLVLASCGAESDGPLTEAQQAEKYNMSVGEFKEQKDAAARMNMTIEDHLKMSDTSGGMDDSTMDMGDDSSMIEDDNDTASTMPEGAHRMPDGTIMNADGSIVGEDGSDISGTHTMDDGTEMKDSEMHMNMLHEGDDIEEHDADTHGDHG